MVVVVVVVVHLATKFACLHHLRLHQESDHLPKPSAQSLKWLAGWHHMKPASTT
jgi:hypothetical protein